MTDADMKWIPAKTRSLANGCAPTSQHCSVSPELVHDNNIRNPTHTDHITRQTQGPQGGLAGRQSQPERRGAEGHARDLEGTTGNPKEPTESPAGSPRGPRKILGDRQKSTPSNPTRRPEDPRNRSGK